MADPIPLAAHQEVPDPSTMTTALILREITSLEKILMTRILAIENAAKLAHDDFFRVPTQVDKAITSLKALLDESINTHVSRNDERLQTIVERFGTVNERFNSIQTQFKERDTRTEQTSRDGKVAIDAALQAAKESVGETNKSSALAIAKSEASTLKQIDAISSNITLISANLSGKIDDVKASVASAINTFSEFSNFSKGGKQNVDDSRANLAVLISIVVAVISISGLIYEAVKGNAPAAPTAPQIVYLPAPAPAVAPAQPATLLPQTLTPR